MDAFAQNGRLGRGVNVFGYDPGWRDPKQRRMQAADYVTDALAVFGSAVCHQHMFSMLCLDTLQTLAAHQYRPRHGHPFENLVLYAACHAHRCYGCQSVFQPGADIRNATGNPDSGQPSQVLYIAGRVAAN